MSVKSECVRSECVSECEYVRSASMRSECVSRECVSECVSE